jgi:murein DD-endopeptidase MepM/ murein hydrolase activator NlpD
VDLVVLDKRGATHRGDGKRLGQYHAFQRRVYAASAGTVARAISALPDNDIGATDESNIDGNHVMIAHHHGTFALYDHLQCGSLTVRVGATVRAGQPIGCVGNSGNATQPHLHMQLQNSGDLDPRVAISIPMVFRSLVVNGAHVHCGELPGSVLVSRHYPT